MLWISTLPYPSIASTTVQREQMVFAIVLTIHPSLKVANVVILFKTPQTLKLWRCNDTIEAALQAIKDLRTTSFNTPCRTQRNLEYFLHHGYPQSVPSTLSHLKIPTAHQVSFTKSSLRLHISKLARTLIFSIYNSTFALYITLLMWNVMHLYTASFPTIFYYYKPNFFKSLN